MALVMLPCDLPWWPMLQRHLTALLSIKTTEQLIQGMQKIHDMCNIGLDPDEDKSTPGLFNGLAVFLECDMTEAERDHFINKTMHHMISRALRLKDLRPSRGLHFSLQQQADYRELDCDFVSSLLAHAFFSTYPKRTGKTHPTLQDFNFTHFFTHLDSNLQKSKLRCILHYFDWLDKMAPASLGSIKISRQVMSSKQWLTIEDWLECSLPLCTLRIKHDGRLERAEPNSLHVCFASALVGGNVLGEGQSQESVQMSTFPEMLCILLSVESLEDNEVLFVEGARQMARITDPKQKAYFEPLDNPKQISVCCVDAEDYRHLPLGQFEEDNVLRELNKCLLAFQQKSGGQIVETAEKDKKEITSNHRRLSPIGESFSTPPPDVEATIIIKQASTSTYHSSRSPSPPEQEQWSSTLKVHDHDLTKRKCRLTPEANTLNNRRGRFIVLGSSGECLPVNRKPLSQCASAYSSCDSSLEEFHSARTSLDEEECDDIHARRYSLELDTPERRHTFAQRLRDALNRESDSISTSTDDSSYAVGISIAGSGLGDNDIRLRRGGSRGFMLTEESMDEQALGDVLSNELLLASSRAIIKHKLQRHNTNESSKYSFSTEYSSELEEVYEQFSRWIEDPILVTKCQNNRELDARDIAVVRFAGSLLKRTLSESFAGVPLTEGCINSAGISADENSIQNYNSKRNKLVLSARSLSLELARHKHRLAAQLTETDENENDTDSISSNRSESLHANSVVTIIDNNDNVIANNDNVIDNNDNVAQTEIPAVCATNMRKRTLLWAVTFIEAIEQTLANDYVTMKLPKSQISQLGQKRSEENGLKVVSTGNWGCGSTKAGETQLKLIIQWLAASVAGAPMLVYYTNGHDKLNKLDTVCRVLLDRKWTVGELATATLKYSKKAIDGNTNGNSLFEELLGVERV